MSICRRRRQMRAGRSCLDCFENQKQNVPCRTSFPSVHDDTLTRSGNQTQPTEPTHSVLGHPSASMPSWARPFEPIFNQIPTPAVMTRHRKYDSKEIGNTCRPHGQTPPCSCTSTGHLFLVRRHSPIVVPRTVSRGIKQDGKSEARHKGNRKTRATELVCLGADNLNSCNCSLLLTTTHELHHLPDHRAGVAPSHHL